MRRIVEATRETLEQPSQHRRYKRGQWDAFDRVLHWINEQDTKLIDKSKLYEAVMDMRPRR